MSDRVHARNLARLLLITGIAVLSAIPAAAAWAAPTGEAQAVRRITVTATGIPLLDREHLQQALASVAVNGTITLKGHFNVGTKCVLCLKVRRPVTIQGVGNPAVANPGSRVTIVQGGLGPFVVQQEVAGGAVRFRNLWFQGQLLIAVAAFRSLDRLEFTSNRVTDVSPLFIVAEQFRFGFGAATIQPPEQVPDNPQIAAHIAALEKAGVPGAPTLAGLEAKYPGISPLFNPAGVELEGSMMVRGNYIDFLSAPDRFRFGDDNSVGIAGCDFQSVSIERNYFATRGETEIEGCRGSGAHYTVAGNTIQMNGPPSIEGFVVRRGGHPAAIKIIGNVSGATVTHNNVSVWGAPPSVAVLAGNTSSDTSSTYANNRFLTSGQRTLFMGGFAGILGFFPDSYLQHALITSNTFAGTTREGIAFVNLPGIGSFPLINRANHVTIVHNDFSGLSSRRATVDFGMATFRNTFIGAPHGRIINRGTHNTIVITH